MLVIMSGPPLDVECSKVDRVFIEGQEVYNEKHAERC